MPVESQRQLLFQPDQMSQEDVDGIFARVRPVMDDAMVRVNEHQGEGDDFLDADDLGQTAAATLITLASVAGCQLGRTHGLKVKESHVLGGKPAVVVLKDDLASLGHHDHGLGLVLQTQNLMLVEHVLAGEAGQTGRTVEASVAISQRLLATLVPVVDLSQEDVDIVDEAIMGKDTVVG